MRMTRRLLFVASLAGLTGGHVLAQRGQSGRPILLLVHGRGMLDRDTAQARKLWVDGLRTGAATVTRASVFEDSDLRVVWYADVLDPASDAGCDYAAADPRARRAAGADDGLRSV